MVLILLMDSALVALIAGNRHIMQARHRKPYLQSIVDKYDPN